MNIQTDDTNYADIENIESIEGIIKIGNSGAPSISDLSPNSDWKCFPQSSYHSCYGLPYQDHNYGAPPPPTPPPSPGHNSAIVTKKKSFEVALKSLKPNKCVPERKVKVAAPKKQTGIKRRNVITKTPLVKPVAVTNPDDVESDEGEEGVVSGDYSDSITRCICNYTHDDGYMICCDQCQVWQHIDCMGIDRANIPDEYSCEQCMPRKVYKARARLIQKKKRIDIMRSSSEEDNSNAKDPPSLLKPNVKGCKTKFSKEQGSQKVQATASQNRAKAVLNNKKKAINTLTSSALRSKRAKRSKDTVLLSVDGETEESPWAVSYEAAKANQYSADIQESLKVYRAKANYQLASVLSELDDPRCHLKLLDNGKRGLEVESNTRSNQALVEFKGKVMLRQQFQQENNYFKRPQPFVLFYDKWDGLDICIDATSLGNEARFVRRSCAPNSEVRHIIENGQVHLVIFSVREISAGSEVTIPYDFDFKSCEYCVECACSRAQCPVRKAGRKAKRSVALGGGDRSLPQPSPSKAPKQTASDRKQRAVHEQLKVQIPTNNCSANENKPQSAVTSNSNMKSPPTEKTVEETRRLSREDRKIKAYMEAFEKMEKREERRKEALQRINEKKEESPTAVVEKPIEPVKGTVQSRTLKAKTKPVAVTPRPAAKPAPKPAPKPAARRRRNKSGPALRRRTTSSGGATAATSQSSSDIEETTSNNQTADENTSSSHIPAPAEVGSTHTGTVSTTSSLSLGFRFPKTKKQIVNDWYHEKGLDKCPMDKQPLSVTVPTPRENDDSIDFVKTNSSPPSSSWEHLRRNSVSGNHVTPSIPALDAARKPLSLSMGSAKKRWLKQAMEEDSSQSNPTPLMSPASEHHSSPPTTSESNSNTTHSLAVSVVVPNNNNMDTPLSPNTEFVTPLKKRRLARESLSLDSHPTSPDSRTFIVPTQPQQSALPKPKLVHIPDNSQSSDELSLCPQNSKAGPISGIKSADEPKQTDSQHQSKRVCEENVPETVRACSPVQLQGSTTNVIPTTVMEVVNSEPMLSPLKRYKLKQHQQKLENDIGTGAGMLSPKEPRTLGDLMQPLASVDSADINGGDKSFNSGNCIVAPMKKRFISFTDDSLLGSTSQDESCAVTSPVVEERSNPNILGESTTGLSTSNLMSKEPVLPVINSVGYLHPQNDLKRSVSLMERTNNGDANSDENYSVEQVHISVKQEPCGGGEYAPTTPPQRKKVSLLEYRKRMQIHTPKSDSSSTSISAPTTPLLTCDMSAKPLQPLTLPSLPLFEELKVKKVAVLEANNSILQRPPISLDERLKMEFGLATRNKIADADDDSDDDAPPPPPPPMPSSYTSTTAPPAFAAKVTRLVCEDLKNSHYTNSLASSTDNEIKLLANGGTTEEKSPAELTGQEKAREPLEPMSMPLPIGHKPAMSPARKAPFSLKQGSLGAVMLGQASDSPISNSRDVTGSRTITQLDLPKKYR